MKIILVILALVFLNSCALIKSKEEKELEILSKNYGGFYVFDRKVREEILEIEKKRSELGDNDKFRTKVGQLKSGEDSEAIDKLFPQIFSF